MSVACYETRGGTQHHLLSEIWRVLILAVEAVHRGLWLGLRGMVLPLAVRIAEHPVFGHGTCDGEQRFGYPRQGACMSVSAAPERCVIRLADGVELPGDGGTVVDGILQTVVGGEPADHDPPIKLLARPPADGAVPGTAISTPPPGSRPSQPTASPVSQYTAAPVPQSAVIRARGARSSAGPSECAHPAGQVRLLHPFPNPGRRTGCRCQSRMGGGRAVGRRSRRRQRSPLPKLGKG